MSRSGTDIAIEAMLSDQETLRAEIGELRAENARLQAALNGIGDYCRSHTIGGWRHDIAAMVDRALERRKE